MLNLAQLLRVPNVDPYNGFDISPDGTRAAYSSNASGIWEIYETDLRAKLPITNQPITDGPGGKFAPRYSPDGKFLAWALDLDGSENFHIVVTQISNLRHTIDLDADNDFAIQPSFAWSPDSKQIACLADKRNIFDLYIRDADGNNDRFVFSPGGPAYAVKWSPDGAHLAVTASMEGQNNGVFIVAAGGGEAHRIGGAGFDAEHPAFSPDGRRVAFTSNTGYQQIGVYDIAAKTVEWITRGESNCSQPFWSADGSRLSWVNARGAATRLEVRERSGDVRTIPAERGLISLPRFAPDGSVIFLFESPLRPPDLWRAAPDDGRPAQLTDSLPAEIRRDELTMPEEITYPSFDGTPVPAILYKPKNATGRAAVIIHGGPSWHISFLWYPIMSHLASRGWTVIAPNYRGSTGYGREWQLANRFEIGRLDSDDCAAAARYLVESGLADSNKIAVTGRSHGGYLTMTCLTRNPELFAVGAAMVPFLNWFTGHENSREDLQHWDIENMGDPVENEALWRERSPFFVLDKVRAPVQLICGENDPRCPPSESIEAHKKLQELGIESELHLYKGEGHAFMKVENVVDAEVKRVEFLAKILDRKRVDK